MNKEKLVVRKKKKLVVFKKVPIRVDIEQWERLDEIRKKFKFKSNYEIMQYILSCFLQAVDLDKSCIDIEKFRDERTSASCRIKRRIMGVDQINHTLINWDEIFKPLN